MTQARPSAPSAVRWLAGAHHGLVWPGGLALVDGVAPLPAVSSLHDALTASARAGIGSVLALLDATLDGAPSAAVVVTTGLPEVAVRGQVTVTVSSDPGPTPDAAGEAATGPVGWTVRALGGARVELAMPDVTAGEWRPVASALLPAGALAWEGVLAPVAPAVPEGLITHVPSNPAPGVLDGGADDGPDPDHDGLTIVPTRRRPGRAPAMSVDPGPPGAVLGIACPTGHVNPPSRGRCRVCHEPLDAEPQRWPRPALGLVRTSTGAAVELTTGIVAGRNPKAPVVPGQPAPRLLPLPHSHVSGSHVELRVEGWTVLAVDLDSTNGTFLRRRGQPAVRLPTTPTLLVDGDVLDLGHGVALTLEGLP